VLAAKPSALTDRGDKAQLGRWVILGVPAPTNSRARRRIRPLGPTGSQPAGAPQDRRPARPTVLRDCSHENGQLRPAEL